MGRIVLLIKDDKLGNENYFIEFSSIVDDFVTSGMTEKHFKLYYFIEYGLNNFYNFDILLEKLKSKNTSSRMFSEKGWEYWLNHRNEIHTSTFEENEGDEEVRVMIEDKILTENQFFKEFIMDAQEENKEFYEKYKNVLELIEKKE